MSDSIKITPIQYDIVWKDAKANRTYLDTILESIEATDLIILPEMFNTGFCMEPQDIAEPMNGETIKWLQNKAQKLNTTICGSLSIIENNNYFNRFVVISPNTTKIQYYDKRHLFSYGGEHEVYEQGQNKITFEINNWNICPLICYDLRFPVWSRNTTDIDVYIYVANWPASRAYPWNQLLTARAIENMSYVVAVNRIGTDGNNLNYQGDSKIIDFLGKEIQSLKDKKSFFTIELFKEKLVTTRKKFGFLNDTDNFEFL